MWVHVKQHWPLVTFWYFWSNHFMQQCFCHVLITLSWKSMIRILYVLVTSYFGKETLFLETALLIGVICPALIYLHLTNRETPQKHGKVRKYIYVHWYLSLYDFENCIHRHICRNGMSNTNATKLTRLISDFFFTKSLERKMKE